MNRQQAFQPACQQGNACGQQDAGEQFKGFHMISPWRVNNAHAEKVETGGTRHAGVALSVTADAALSVTADAVPPLPEGEARALPRRGIEPG